MHIPLFALRLFNAFNGGHIQIASCRKYSSSSSLLLRLFPQNYRCGRYLFVLVFTRTKRVFALSLPSHHLFFYFFPCLSNFFPKIFFESFFFSFSSPSMKQCRFSKFLSLFSLSNLQFSCFGAAFQFVLHVKSPVTTLKAPHNTHAPESKIRYFLHLYVFYVSFFFPLCSKKNVTKRCENPHIA